MRTRCYSERSLETISNAGQMESLSVLVPGAILLRRKGWETDPKALWAKLSGILACSKGDDNEGKHAAESKVLLHGSGRKERKNLPVSAVVAVNGTWA